MNSKVNENIIRSMLIADHSFLSKTPFFATSLGDVLLADKYQKNISNRQISDHRILH